MLFCLIHNLWLYERASQQAFSLQIFLGRSTGVTHNVHNGCVPLRSPSVHNSATLKLKQLNRMRPLLILVFTPVLLRLWTLERPTELDWRIDLAHILAEWSMNPVLLKLFTPRTTSSKPEALLITPLWLIDSIGVTVLHRSLLTSALSSVVNRRVFEIFSSCSAFSPPLIIVPWQFECSSTWLQDATRWSIAALITYHISWCCFSVF